LPGLTVTRLALRAQAVTVSHGSEQVLAEQTLELLPGQAPLGLIGPSGAGKTSLVEVLAGWRPPTSGVVALGELNPYNPPRRYRQLVRAALRGVAEEQDPVFAQRFKGTYRLSRALQLARRTHRKTFTANELCQLVGYDPANLNRLMRQTSLGEQQRLAMAAALASDPDVLILDEPATALDPAARHSVLAAVVDWACQRGTAVLLVSHDLDMIESLTSSALVLVDGHQVACGRLGGLLSSPAKAHPYLADLAAIRSAETSARPSQLRQQQS
jgi:ABC-type multidrug transport system ATPase subunit